MSEFTWYVIGNEFYTFREDAEGQALLMGVSPDSIEVIHTTSNDAWNGYVTKRNWCEWHGEEDYR